MQASWALIPVVRLRLMGPLGTRCEPLLGSMLQHHQQSYGDDSSIDNLTLRDISKECGLSCLPVHYEVLQFGLKETVKSNYSKPSPHFTSPQWGAPWGASAPALARLVIFCG